MKKKCFKQLAAIMAATVLLGSFPGTVWAEEYADFSQQDSMPAAMSFSDAFAEDEPGIPQEPEIPQEPVAPSVPIVPEQPAENPDDLPKEEQDPDVEELIPGDDGAEEITDEPQDITDKNDEQKDDAEQIGDDGEENSDDPVEEEILDVEGEENQAGRSTYTLKLWSRTEESLAFQLESTVTITRDNPGTAPKTGLRRAGYSLTWNTQKDGKGSTYRQGASLSALLNEAEKIKEGEDVLNLYGIWTPVNYRITYVLNGGQNHASNPKTYRTNTITALKNPTRSGYRFLGWYKEKNFKTKVTSIDPGTVGALTLYARWLVQVSPSTSAASLTSCAGYAQGTIAVTATVPKYVQSVDNYYYLLQMNPNTNKVARWVARVGKPQASNRTITFHLKTEGHPEYAQAQFAIGVKKAKASAVSSYTRISNTSYVSNPENLAYNRAAYRVPKTKKGIQTGVLAEAVTTNCDHLFMNMYASYLYRQDAYTVDYTYNGKTYRFNSWAGLQALVRECNKKGIQVTVQILLDWTPETKHLIYASSPGPSSALYAWNTESTAARQEMEALFSFVSEVFGQDDCYVSNWILGNEVNSCNVWNYPGNMGRTKFLQSYAKAFRSLYNAVRSNRASSKVFTCLDIYWNQAVYGYSGKDFVDSLAVNLGKLQKNVNWNLAYHPYPFPLTDPEFWITKHPTMVTNRVDSPVVAINNLSVLTNYIRTTYGIGTRIILSESGYTSTMGQDTQAAALSLSYYIAACNPMIDAFIVRSYEDEAHEVAQGLAFGIKGKKAFQTFTNMNTKNGLKYTQTYLTKKVGSNWKKLVPGYKENRLYTMFRYNR